MTLFDHLAHAASVLTPAVAAGLALVILQSLAIAAAIDRSERRRR